MSRLSAGGRGTGAGRVRRASADTAPPPVPVHVFRTTDVARILGVSPQRVRAVVRAGLCRPVRNRHAWEFGFQDLVHLRAAHGLLAAKVPPRRVRQALTELRAQLPGDRPLSGVRVYADGRHVIVRDGPTTWSPESGQLLFSFAVDDLARAAGVVVSVDGRRGRAGRQRQESADPAVWFERALQSERTNDRAGACDAYRKAIELDPELADAYVNLGRLIHEDGDPIEAARLYHLAIEHAPDDPVAHYDLAIALEDQELQAAATSHYRQALRIDPDFADAHFNLARLLDRSGQRTEAMRHLLTYRRLTER